MAVQRYRNSNGEWVVLGEELKTINGQSLIGEGNITIEGGGGSVTIDSELSATSENPVQNKVITPALAAKADITYVNEAIANAITTTLNTAV